MESLQYETIRILLRQHRYRASLPFYWTFDEGAMLDYMLGGETLHLSNCFKFRNLRKPY